MRNASRRSFTVEVKSDRRRPTTIIPTRVAAPSVPPRLTPEPMPEAKAPIVEKRRILPALTPQALPSETEPLAAEERTPSRPRGRPRKLRPEAIEPVAEERTPSRPRGRPRKLRPEAVEPVAEERTPARPRGRPRKLRPDAIELVAEFVEKPASALVAVSPLPLEVPPAVRSVKVSRDRNAAPALDLPRGERWKRRLGRWSR